MTRTRSNANALTLVTATLAGTLALGCAEPADDPEPQVFVPEYGELSDAGPGEPPPSTNGGQDADVATDGGPQQEVPEEPPPGDCAAGQTLPCAVHTCDGVRLCVDGAWSAECTVSPSAETCDGLDNNCDGQVDEGVRNACGECGPVAGEISNGRDDNCNGQIDEGLRVQILEAGDLSAYNSGCSSFPLGSNDWAFCQAAADAFCRARAPHFIGGYGPLMGTGAWGASAWVACVSGESGIRRLQATAGDLGLAANPDIAALHHSMRLRALQFCQQRGFVATSGPVRWLDNSNVFDVLCMPAGVSTTGALPQAELAGCGDYSDAAMNRASCGIAIQTYCGALGWTAAAAAPYMNLGGTISLGCVSGN